MHITIKLASIRAAIVVAALGALAGGCSRTKYRLQADREAYDTIAERNGDPRWETANVSIEMDPKSRFFDPYDPDQSPMPPDDPTSHVYMHCVDGMEGWKHWHDNGHRSELENPGWREALGHYVTFDEQGEVQLDIESSVRLAYVNSPTIQRQLNAIKATHQANVETALADQQRLDRALEELQFCVVKAGRPGLVIYPKAQEWENAPEIEEGATVHKDQVMLLMPDLARMQVKVGIHESMVDRVRPGLPARVILPGKSLDGTVSDVAAVTRPAGWWTGNVVKYDTIVELPKSDGLKPGMSVEVEVVLAQYDDVLLIPATAVLETADGFCCWVDEAGIPARRQLQLGDSNEMFLIVEAGLEAGDRVVLDPLASIDEAQSEATRVREPGDMMTDMQEVPTS